MEMSQLFAWIVSYQRYKCTWRVELELALGCLTKYTKSGGPNSRKLCRDSVRASTATKISSSSWILSSVHKVSHESCNLRSCSCRPFGTIGMRAQPGEHVN